MIEEISKCKKCNADIKWLKTANDKWMPVDYGTWTGETIYDRDIHMTHYATCKYADQFRKPRESQKTTAYSQYHAEIKKDGNRNVETEKAILVVFRNPERKDLINGQEHWITKKTTAGDDIIKIDGDKIYIADWMIDAKPESTKSQILKFKY
jgi:hypothetical protein